MPPDRSDADLVIRLRAGDEGAFVELVERYHPQLIRLAHSFVASPELAEDVAQETWLALLKSLDRFEGRSTLRTWLFQVCANRARTIGVKEHRTVPTEHIGPAVDARHFTAVCAWTSPPTPWPDLLADDQSDAELAAEIRATINELPPLQRAVVTLRDGEGRSSQEVCAILSITAANQRVLLHRGREKIRSHISRAVSRS